MGTFSRTILRKSAKTNMEKAGKTHINKKHRSPETDKVYSYFSLHWRAYAPHKIEEESETEA